MVTDWNGLKDFTTVSIKDAAGNEVAELQDGLLPQRRTSSARTRRDAPAENPYPRACSAQPVQPRHGLGHPGRVERQTASMPAWDWSQDAPRVRHPDRQVHGHGDAEPGVPRLLQDRGADASTLTVNVTVEDAGPTARLAWRRPRPRSKATQLGEDTTEAAAVAEHGEHGGQGDASLQVSAYKPGFRPPAKKPKAVKAARIAEGPAPRPALAAGLGHLAVAGGRASGTSTSAPPSGTAAPRRCWSTASGGPAPS